ncbi:uncharacterized protein LY89DRAFT_473499 [Mollisia scopiformis]|uniref:Uncharacterized protein n=1 Tax=Mollisia scopiformis TaxID=149040 RepID=A0A194XJ96_MOLSC|nr:uncharacterized protein LY89DRAFT_473499 [Mollisia scopiformis]KUJ20194.1 hypothetical protein LY89DRAFT_473499 [Mollisia scopiformis]
MRMVPGASHRRHDHGRLLAGFLASLHLHLHLLTHLHLSLSQLRCLPGSVLSVSHSYSSPISISISTLRIHPPRFSLSMYRGPGSRSFSSRAPTTRPRPQTKFTIPGALTGRSPFSASSHRQVFSPPPGPAFSLFDAASGLAVPMAWAWAAFRLVLY